MKTFSQDIFRVTRISQRLGLFWQFVFLSLIVFMIMGYVVVSAVQPAIRSFIATQQERDAVVFANRIANELLTPEDFRWPSDASSREKLQKFSQSLQIPARFHTLLMNRDGVVVYSDAEALVGQAFSTDTDIRKVLDGRVSIAEFGTSAEVAAAHAVYVREQHIADFFEIYIPITFGADSTVQAILNTYSRTGFINKSASDVSRTLATRIVAALTILYVALAGIVWRASRTIIKQRDALHTYTVELEERVHERTKKIEEIAKRELAQATELARLKDEFVFIAAHELRTPVVGINWNLELALKDPAIERLSEKGRGYIKEARTSGKRLVGLVQDLLSVSRIEAGTLHIEMLPTSVEPALRITIADIEAIAKEKNVIIRYDAGALAALPKVMMDEARIREVFLNLLANAVKFNVDGGEVEVRGLARDTVVEIQFRDTGIGITEDEQKSLFKKFWRVHHEIPGTGLGLWIVKELIEKMGGVVTVESGLGKGSTFTVALQIAKEPSRAAEKATESEKSTSTVDEKKEIQT